MRRHLRFRAAFTLVELLVVIAIIGMLVGLLLPAVNSARESGRKTICGNNIRQLSIALRAYEPQHNTLPPAITFAAGENVTTSRKYGRNWIIELLPYIDQDALYNSFNLKLPISDPANATPRSTNIASLVCPTDSGARQKFSRAGDGDNWARGNYGANGCMAHLGSCNGRGSAGWANKYSRGVMGLNVANRLGDITDGESHTIMLAEVRIGLTAIDHRGVWAMGAPGASSIWAHANDDATGPNSGATAADNLLDCNLIVDSEGGPNAVYAQKMGCYTGGNVNTQSSPRSRHAGGCFFTFADASVHFISETIDMNKQWDFLQYIKDHPGDFSEFRVWERLNASRDGLPIDDTQYQ